MNEAEDNDNWLNIADVMSALMMVFLFIAVSFMYQLENEKELYRVQLNNALHQEFDGDLGQWKAKITDKNIIRFSSPFAVGSSDVPVDFMQVLDAFFPRYIALLTKNDFKSEIEEVRVEGHTTYGWGDSATEEEIYINNMALSQRRASNVLAYTYQLITRDATSTKHWLQNNLRANGMAFSQVIYEPDGLVSDKSRRVEFRVITRETTQL